MDISTSIKKTAGLNHNVRMLTILLFASSSVALITKRISKIRNIIKSRIFLNLYKIRYFFRIAKSLKSFKSRHIAQVVNIEINVWKMSMFKNTRHSFV